MSTSYAQTFPSIHTFLKMQEPEVMSPDEPNPPEEKTIEWMTFWLFRTSDLRFIPDPRLVDYVAEYKRCQRKETVPWKNTQDFLDIMFPTKYWTERGIRYKQKVSTGEVTRPDLQKMNALLDNQLKYRQSQASTGYCPIRFGLHMELLDEVVRQVAINSPSRAFMLERVRGELNQTLDAYRKVLDVSLVEEMKQTVSSDKPDMEIQLLQKKLEHANAELEEVDKEYNNVNADLKVLLTRYELFENIRTQLHEPEIQFTQKLKDALVRQLYHFENPPEFETGEDDPTKK